MRPNDVGCRSTKYKIVKEIVKESAVHHLNWEYRTDVIAMSKRSHCNICTTESFYICVLSGWWLWRGEYLAALELGVIAALLYAKFKSKDLNFILNSCRVISCPRPQETVSKLRYLLWALHIQLVTKIIKSKDTTTCVEKWHKPSTFKER